jgi:O-antigen/teichoic acid export membrane protein
MMTDIVLVQFCREEAEVVLYNATMLPIIGMEQLLWAIAQVIVPFAAAGAALDQGRTLRQTILRGARATLLIALPMITYLCLAGRGFFGAWMFDKKEFPLEHVTQAQHLVWILAPAFVLLFLQQPAIAVLIGSGRVRAPALINLGQGVAKIVLSLILVRYLGLTGIALGTVIPLLVANLFVLPWFVKREIGVGWFPLLHHAVRPALLTLAFAGPLAYALLAIVGATDTSMWRLRFQIPIALGVAVIFAVVAWFVGLNAEDRRWVRDRQPWRRRPETNQRPG